MTLPEAITALLDEFDLEAVEDCVRDDVRGDPAFDGLSHDHPKVQRFREVCRVLRAAQNTIIVSYPKLNNIMDDSPAGTVEASHGR